MASRRAAPNQQPQNPRFSWQLPLDDISQRPLHIDTSSHVTQQQQQQFQQHGRNPGQQRAEDANRYSWMETPVEVQNPTFARSAEPRRPSGPGMSPIPQSPETPIEPGVAQRHSLLPPSALHGHPQVQAPQQQYDYPDEKKSHFPAPQQAHPAEYSPYPDSILQSPAYIQHPSSPPPTFQAHPPQPYGTAPPPHSPGPLPTKGDRKYEEPPVSPGVRKSMPPAADPTYIPHTNTLLKSPTSPIFSPDSLSHPAAAGRDRPPPRNHQPGQIAHPNMDHSTPGSQLQWRHGLCDCCGSGVGTCLEGILCPCIVHGRTTYRLSQKGVKKDPTDLLGWSRFNGSCLTMALTCGLCGLLPSIARTRIRHAYHLAGSVPSDLVRGCCCCCCVVVQNELEVKDREDTSRRWAGPGAGDAYTPGDPMVYAPPPRR